MLAAQIRITEPAAVSALRMHCCTAL
jgi:hypothetical protein